MNPKKTVAIWSAMLVLLAGGILTIWSGRGAEKKEATLTGPAADQVLMSGSGEPALNGRGRVASVENTRTAAAATLTVRVVDVRGGMPVGDAVLRAAIPVTEAGSGRVEGEYRVVGRTNENGEVGFLWGADGIAIEVWSKEELCHRCVIGTIASRFMTIEVGSGEAVAVRVVKAGAGLGGVPVYLRFDRTASRGADGAAKVIRHQVTEESSGVASFVDVFHSTRSKVRDVVAGLDLPLRAPVEEAVENVRGRLATLGMPETGRVRVRVVERGRGTPVPGVKVRLSAYHGENDAVPIKCTARWGEGTTDQDGEYVVRYVGTGLWIAGQAMNDMRNRSMSRRVRGPEVEGNSVTVTLVAEGGSMRISAVLVRSDGTPWAETIVKVTAFPGDASSTKRGFSVRMTDNNGRVEFSVPSHDVSRRGLLFAGVDSRGRTGPRGICLFGSELTAEEVDLGEVVMGDGDLLASGVVSGTSGVPLPVSVTAKVETVAGGAYPPELLIGNPAWAEDGRFVIKFGVGWREEPALVKLLVKGKDGGRCEVEGSVGRNDWVIVMRQKARARGSIRLRPGETPLDYRILVLGSGSGGAGKIDKDGRFELRGLEPGRYEVLLTLRSEDLAGSGRAACRVKDVVVGESSEASDRRLWNLHVEPRYAAYQIRVLDASGQAVVGARITDPELPLYTINSDAAGVARVRVPHGKVLKVSKAGYESWVGSVRATVSEVILLPKR